MAPLELRLLNDRRVLAVTWADGAVTHLDAVHLRRHSRGASAVRAGLEGAVSVPDDDLAVADIEMIGSYAVRFTFSDGHDRGIYPWGYLQELAALAAV